jgi:heme exporter protein C
MASATISRHPFRDLFLPGACAVAMVAALALVFVFVPSERDQGIVQRIFYFHVAAAWMAFAGFAAVAVAGAWFLKTGSRRADHLAIANAEAGMLYTTIVLVTGPIWARPIWGVWWTWDPRITMTVVLWTIYAAYLMMRRLGAGDAAISRYAAVLGIVGVLDIPLLILSVRMWRGMHPAVMLSKDPNAGLQDPMMRWTLVVSGLALALLFVWMVSLRARLHGLDDALSELQLAESDGLESRGGLR